MAKRKGNYGKWKVGRQLGEGGQAVTFLAFETGNETAGGFVLKRLKKIGRLGRFRDEARAGLRLEHPNIVHVEESDLEAPRPYIVTKLYSRGKLTAKLIQGKTLIERLALFLGICEGVGYAHENGVRHRDLKPENIFIKDDGAPVVGDFGLCFFEDSSERFTLVDEAVGSRWYMAPELESGKAREVAPTCDVYSLGKLLYFILAGRIFDRERHREPDWDLNPGLTDPDLTLVYELLDGLIAADPSHRMLNGSSVAQEVQRLIYRIERRRRTCELAGASCCHQAHKMHIASFRPGSVVTTHFVNPPGRAVLGFGVSGSTLAAWGRRTREHGQVGDNLEVMICRAPGDFRSVVAERSGTILQTQSEGRSALAFRPPYHDPVIAFVEKSGSGASASLTVISVDQNSQVIETLFAESVHNPRNVAIAVGPSGEMAIHVAPESSSLGTRSEVFYQRKDAAAEHVPLPHNTNFPGPLAFDRDGRLHQVYAVSAAEGGRETRNLVHRWREPNGEWYDEVVASARAGPMSAHIDLALTPDGLPVVFSDWDEKSGGRSVVCYEKRAEGWQTERIDLTEFIREFGPLGIAAGGAKQILIDAHGDKHIAIYSDAGGGGNVLYLAIHSDFIERRVFPAHACIGMGIDELETVYVAVL